MSPKSQPRITILGISLLAAGLVIALVGCLDGAPGGVVRTSPSEPTPTAAPRLVAEQQMILDELKRRHDCDPDCLATRQANNSYAEYGTPHHILRPEWQKLFPKAQFYVVPWVDHYQGNSYQRNSLLVSYKGQWYEPKTYDLLLDANGITVTDDNRELVAKAWALMTIEDYLDGEVVLTEWKGVETPVPLHNFNYSLYGWTKIRGLQLRWWFVFEGPKLNVASGPGVLQSGIGEYYFSELPEPLFLDYPFYLR